MCTAATYMSKDFYFGRTLDYDYIYDTKVVVMPRNYHLKFSDQPDMISHFAMIGMAVTMGIPLFCEAVNEKGLGIAGLNFVGNAAYNEPVEGKFNVASYELIPWILGQCDCLDSAKELLKDLNITNRAFSPELPPAELHWIIADKTGSITVESTVDGLKIYENPVGVLTNNPTFDKQLFNLNNFRHISPESREVGFSKNLSLDEYSRGMGAIGLPGDLSSQSRFVRVAFVKMNSISYEDENSSVSQFFHILNSVDQQRGCCNLGEDKYEITLYTSCCNADKGIYYYTTYDNHRINAVDMHKTDLDSDEISVFELDRIEDIRWNN